MSNFYNLFDVSPNIAFEQIAELPEIWNTMTPLWRHCNDICLPSDGLIRRWTDAYQMHVQHQLYNKCILLNLTIATLHVLH